MSLATNASNPYEGCQVWRASVVGGWLGHNVERIEVAVNFGALPLPVGSLVFLFPAALTPIRACHRGDSSNLINTITVEEELEAAQSKASNKDVRLFQVR